MGFTLIVTVEAGEDSDRRRDSVELNSGETFYGMTRAVASVTLLFADVSYHVSSTLDQWHRVGRVINFATFTRKTFLPVIEAKLDFCSIYLFPVSDASAPQDVLHMFVIGASGVQVPDVRIAPALGLDSPELRGTLHNTCRVCRPGAARSHSDFLGRGRPYAEWN
jgi:hypothetical protein